jgi:hypothetical protein
MNMAWAVSNLRDAVRISAAFFVAAVALSAANLAGVTLPDSTSAGGHALVLNGMGLRTRFTFKVYVAGLYLPQKSNDGPAIAGADLPKRIVLHFVRDVESDSMKEAISNGFDDNAKKTLKAQIDQFTSALEPFKVGDEMSVTYLPGTGTVLNVKGKDKLTIPGMEFAKALFGIWLGPKPPSAELKKGLLGS